MSDAPTPDPAADNAAPETDESAVQRTPALVDPTVHPEQPAGVPHGTQVKSPHGNLETIIHDVDEELGQLVGWHKEHVSGPGDATPAPAA